MWMPRALGALVAAPLVAIAAQAPPPPPSPLPGGPTAFLTRTAAVSGSVVDASTGAPIAGAVVEVSLEGRPIRTDSGRPRATDERGRFVFTDLPAGALAVRASALGYLSSGFASEGWSPVDRFPAAPGEWISDVRLTLARPGVIAGSILNERNEPVVGVLVGVIERIHVAGSVHYTSGRAAVTDDRGHFRIIDLTPGDYFVQVPGSAASPSLTPIPQPFPGQAPVPPPDVDGIRLTYPTTYHPGASSTTTAQLVSLHAGETREGVDVRLAPARAARVTGIIDGPADWLAGVVVRLQPEDRGARGAAQLSVRTDATGRFTFERVPEGKYTLIAGTEWSEFTAGVRLGEPSIGRASSLGLGGMTEDVASGPPGLRVQTTTTGGSGTNVARQPLTVSAPAVDNLVLTARSTAVMRGRITREIADHHPRPNLDGAGLRLDPADASADAGLPRMTGRPDVAADDFTIEGIGPGRFHLRASYGWLIKSVTWNGRDHARVPFDTAETTILDNVAVVVTNASATLNGVVRGTPPGGHVVVLLFPAAEDGWVDFGLMPVDVRRAATTTDGRFTIGGLPAGDYLVVATDGSQHLDLHADTFRRLQPSAEAIRLDWGETRRIDLSLAGARP